MHEEARKYMSQLGHKSWNKRKSPEEIKRLQEAGKKGGRPRKNPETDKPQDS